MYFSDALALALRQWKVVVIGLVLLAAAAFAVVRVVPTEHQATGQQMLLLPPAYHGKDTLTNPFLNLPAELTTTASLLAGSVMTKDVIAELDEDGADAEYDVSVVPGAGPLLVISTRDTDADAAIMTRDAVMERLAGELDEIQTEARVPGDQVIRLQPFSVSASAEALPGSRLRALAVVGGVGLVLIVLLAFGLDRFSRRGGRRSASRRASTPAQPPARPLAAVQYPPTSVATHAPTADQTLFHHARPPRQFIPGYSGKSGASGVSVPVQEAGPDDEHVTQERNGGHRRSSE